MIFVTTGTQEPFDRLIKVIDEIATTISEEIIVQAFSGGYQAKNIKLQEFLAPKEFDKFFKEARLIVSHAGMGTILSALTSKKPIVVIPRLAKLGEHRSEHQLATAVRFRELKYIYVAMDELELKIILKDLLFENEIKPLHHIGKYASEDLLRSLSNLAIDN